MCNSHHCLKSIPPALRLFPSPIWWAVLTFTGGMNNSAATQNICMTGDQPLFLSGNLWLLIGPEVFPSILQNLEKVTLTDLCICPGFFKTPGNCIVTLLILLPSYCILAAFTDLEIFIEGQSTHLEDNAALHISYTI